MSRISVKSWLAGLVGILKRSMGLDIVSNDNLLLSSTLFQLVLLFLLLAGAVVLVAVPAEENTRLSDWKMFGMLLILGGLGYFLVSRRILRRLSEEVRRHSQFISD